MMIGFRTSQVSEKVKETTQYSLKIKNILLINTEVVLYLSGGKTWL